MEGMMKTYDFIVMEFVAADDFVQKFFPRRSLRKRGPLPQRRDSEVITVKIAGEFLGFDTVKIIYKYFNKYWYNCLLRLIDRTKFARQSDNLCRMKKRLPGYPAQNHKKFIYQENIDL